MRRSRRKKRERAKEKDDNDNHEEVEEAKKKETVKEEEEDEEEKHVEVEETAGAAEKPKMGHVLPRKGVGSEMKEDGEGGLGSIPASADGAPPPPVSPPVLTGFTFSRAAGPTFYSNLLVSSCSLLYLPSLLPVSLSLARSLFLSHPLPPCPPRGGPPSACRPHSGPRCSIHCGNKTKRPGVS